MVSSLALAGAGYSAFQSQAQPIRSPLSTATIQLSLTGTGSTGSLAIGANNLVPGDSIQREVMLENTGSASIGTVSMQITNSTNTALSSNASDGLQIGVRTCPLAWTATSLSDGGYSYSCAMTPTTVIASEPIGTLEAVTPLPIPAIPVAGAQAIVIAVTLPTSAGNSFQGLNDTLTYTFTATQAQGTVS